MESSYAEQVGLDYPPLYNIYLTQMYRTQVAKGYQGAANAVHVLKVPLAGHQVFMDNPPEFNRMLLDALKPSLAK